MKMKKLGVTTNRFSPRAWLLASLACASASSLYVGCRSDDGGGEGEAPPASDDRLPDGGKRSATLVGSTVPTHGASDASADGHVCPDGFFDCSATVGDGAL